MRHLEEGLMQHPLARTEGLSLTHLGEELMLYDEQSHKAHSLNATASWVWQHCDGQTSIAELAERLHRERGLPRSEELIRLALDQLARRGLLQNQSAPLHTPVGRRDTLKALAIAVASLPLVVTMASRPARAAASVITPCLSVTSGKVIIAPRGTPCPGGTCDGAGSCVPVCPPPPPPPPPNGEEEVPS
jgi:hypothetical protein